LINNGKSGGELIRSEAGELSFCKECSEYDTCDHNGQRVYQCNIDIIDFVNEIDSGFKMYIWEGNYREQPAWWYKLLKTCQNTIAEIRGDNAKRLQDKNSRRQ